MKTLIAAVALATASSHRRPLRSPPSGSGAGSPVRFRAGQPGAPAAAQRSHGRGAAQTSPYNAYNAVTPFGSPAKATNTAREKALRDCSTLAGAFKENTWGSMASQQYRSCMAQHGQAE